MKPLDLITVAEILLNHNPRRPTDVCLKRAVSSIYYAAFHCLAQSCADAFIGQTNVVRSSKAWQKTYRSLDHGTAKSACANIAAGSFSPAILDFADMFVALQKSRHEADYNPHAGFKKSEVLAELSAVKAAMIDFDSVSIQEKRAFASHVLLKGRR